MKLTWDDVRDKIEKMGFEWVSAESNGNLYQIELENYTLEGQDVISYLQCEKDNPSSVADAFKELYENYDPDAEAMLWLGPDGHGKNGAPYYMGDLLKDMEDQKAKLEDAAIEMKAFVQNFDIEYTIEQIGIEFITSVKNLANKENIEPENAINIAKSACDTLINNNKGSPKQKKELLNEYFKENGLVDENEKTCADFLNREINKRLRNELKNENIHRMFNSLFLKAECTLKEYGDYVFSAGRKNEIPVNRKKWWKDAVNHAVNSGGELWQDTQTRLELFDKYGLTEYNENEKKLISDTYEVYKKYMKTYGTEKDIFSKNDFKNEIFPNRTDMTEYLSGNEKLLKKYNIWKNDEKREEKLFETADKKYAEYMYEYLTDLRCLDEGKLDALIEKNKAKLHSR